MAEALPPQLLDRLEEIDDLPSLPAVLLRLMELCAAEELDVKAIARLIETDAALSAKVIGLVNSLSYGLPNRVAGLGQAIVLLGTESIKSIAICASLATAFSGSRRAGAAGALELTRVWRHSLLCALVARSLAAQASYLNSDEAFLAGLLHDVGKLVLLSLFPEEYPRCLARSRANPDLLLVDDVRLGGLHDALGAWLVRRWRLPEPLAEATECHHELLHRLVAASPLVRFVFAADLLATATAEREQYCHERAATLLELPASAVAEATARAARELEETARALGFGLEAAEESVLRALASLFHVDAALYFSYATSSDSLRCVGLPRRAAAQTQEGFVVSRGLSTSAVAQPSRSGQVKYAFGSPGADVDLRMRRLMGVDGFACYPLAARGQAVGVLVAGCGAGLVQALRKKEKPLLLLAGEAALALQADRLLERELDRVRDERFAAAQLLADRVVHEVRSPLAAIKNSVGALQGGAMGAEARAILGAVSGEVDRVGRLLGRLATLSAIAPLELSETDVGDAVASFLPVLKKMP